MFNKMSSISAIPTLKVYCNISIRRLIIKVDIVIFHMEWILNIKNRINANGMNSNILPKKS